MRKETRTAVFDDVLRIEAYRFEGIVQPFPNHFHDYYVVGLVESGTRRLSCNNREYALGAGDMLLLNPSDSHGCVQTDGGALDYRAVNISKEIMTELSREITGESTPPRFSGNVLNDCEIADCFRRLHDMIMCGHGEFEKEETLLILISSLIKLSKPFLECVSRYSEPIERACRYMDEHFDGHITLEQLCKCSGLSKSTLLRSFTNVKGVTPYRYLQALRIGKAKELLEQGAKPADAALQTGFSDQSHFTNSFGTFIGLPPAAYRRFTENKENKNE